MCGSSCISNFDSCSADCERLPMPPMQPDQPARQPDWKDMPPQKERRRGEGNWREGGGHSIPCLKGHRRCHSSPIGDSYVSTVVAAFFPFLAVQRSGVFSVLHLGAYVLFHVYSPLADRLLSFSFTFSLPQGSLFALVYLFFVVALISLFTTLFSVSPLTGLVEWEKCVREGGNKWSANPPDRAGFAVVFLRFVLCLHAIVRRYELIAHPWEEISIDSHVPRGEAIFYEHSFCVC